MALYVRGSRKIANAYPRIALLPCRWGSVNSPDFALFDGGPARLAKAIISRPEDLPALATACVFDVGRPVFT